MIKVGVIGAGGYAGVNLISLLLSHPETKLVWVMSEEAHKGRKMSELFPHLTSICEMPCKTLDEIEKCAKEVDVVFLALPHGIALNYVPQILKSGAKVVDLGADYRFSDEKVFEKWYQVEHKDKGAVAEAVFGLPELYKKDIKKARLIGNPGCYPTATILGTAPLVKEGLIDPASIIVDAKSGVSGAGRGVKLITLYCERNEGVMAYAVTNHRHMGEIDFQLGRVAGGNIQTTFVPHLIPQTRGILSTIYAKLKKPAKTADLMKLYENFYRGQPFVRIYPTPSTKNVSFTNYCDIGVAVNEATKTVIVTSAIDNLIKGAAGQAIQNMNLIFGLDETTGLNQIGVFP
ncbi:MAG: N-acetyl-gamma-glutamyl-phosphate reductase [Candidatus Saganbacteria bacterium]|nr:N-acetyl-gamma-glutamyl-phosphate reductase [Candidatus Saganbacteria bacterium]